MFIVGQRGDRVNSTFLIGMRSRFQTWNRTQVGRSEIEHESLPGYSYPLTFLSGVHARIEVVGHVNGTPSFSELINVLLHWLLVEEFSIIHAQATSKSVMEAALLRIWWKAVIVLLS